MFCLIYHEFSRLKTRVIYIATRSIFVKRCYNVSATFVTNKLSASFQQCFEKVVC